MEKFSKYYFLLICISIVVVARRDVDSSIAKFAFANMNLQSWMTKFCSHFCEHSMAKAMRTFSWCSVKCPSSMTQNSIFEEPTTPATSSSSTAMISPPKTKITDDKGPNNGGTVVIIDNPNKARKNSKEFAK
ncbi:uncharacterized protein [Fopius arisanus]|uniref:MACF1_1 protein n=1 Tax=Fopius arisanus TaxID=64838 RepID=A0A0C9QR25_9HYME|nr:PREDICTED: uncharacterized protein LOC105265153 [Fopius arisanus]